TDHCLYRRLQAADDRDACRDPAAHRLQEGIRRGQRGSRGWGGVMTGRTRRSADRGTSTPGGSTSLGSASARPPSAEPTLNQLLAEPIVQQLMRRDQTDEATIRHLLQV